MIIPVLLILLVIAERGSAAPWVEDTSVGATKSWRGITSSADGTKLAATVSNGNIWTSIDWVAVLEGAHGPVGPAGANGAQGIAGANGTDGSDGTQGPAGANGTDGSDGTQGPAGANGTDGSQGAPGINGTNGVGMQGPAGYNGTDGVCACNNSGATTGIGKLIDENLYYNQSNIIGGGVFLLLLNLFTLGYVCVSKGKERSMSSVAPGK